MPGDPTGGRLRLKAFCPAGNPPFLSACTGTVAQARRGRLGGTAAGGRA